MRKWLYIILCALAFVSCKEYTVSDDPALRLSFSTDTLRFDTVFTAQGSSTMQLKVYNRNASAIEIERISMVVGAVFQINIDGESDPTRMTHFVVNGGDSAFVFVRVDINPNNEHNAFLETDELRFFLSNGATQAVQLEAYGQNVTRLRGKDGMLFVQDYTFTNTLPYLIYDTMVVDGKMTLQAGARLYMHNNACLYAQGDVEAQGTVDAPIIIRGDRLDQLFDSVPYAYAGGSWNGLYLISDQPRNYDLSYVDILSGHIGLYCGSTCTDPLPQLRMDGCRIHNHTQYGLVLEHVDALVTNTEISNCASYCVYCSGGKHDFIHTTVASYFGCTNIRIQNVAKEDVAAVYIDDLNKTAPKTNTSFYNSIITGHRDNQLIVATPIERFYPGHFVGCFIGADTAKVFVNDFYKYKEYVYYDFHLDSISPAIGIGDSIVALPYPTDRDGFSRAGTTPDAGCYQHPL